MYLTSKLDWNVLYLSFCFFTILVQQSSQCKLDSFQLIIEQPPSKHLDITTIVFYLYLSLSLLSFLIQWMSIMQQPSWFVQCEHFSFHHSSMINWSTQSFTDFFSFIFGLKLDHFKVERKNMLNDYNHFGQSNSCSVVVPVLHINWKQF